MKSHPIVSCLLFVAVIFTLPLASAEKLHFTYLWHLEQPIYWPDRQVPSPDRYERAWQSIVRTDGGASHPANNLREIFGKDDRVAVYQWRVRDSIDTIRWANESGAQVSYSGGLIENVTSLGEANQLGYSSTWYNPYREARNWTTTGGKPRLDVVVFPFHHPLLPLCDESTVRMEIQLYKQIYDDAWGSSPGMSMGMFPPEIAFSERLIKIFVEEGIDWVVVSNEHISRACENFPVVLGTGGINCDPPNLADQLNPSQSQWFRQQIDRGCSPANAYPYAYTPHYARYVDPDTGGDYQMIVIPAAQALGWKDGYAPLGLEHFDTLQTQNPPDRPQLVVLAHDGDNAWGGGYSYYMEAVPNFVSSAQSSGYVATMIEQYLANHPVPTGEITHVEDGAWVNADGDFGSPVFLNWNWPLVNASGQIDIPNGWAEDERNWAIITAAQNHVDTAEQIAGSVNLERILYPVDGSTTLAEHAWHYFLAGLNSGFMYYGTSLDHEVKATIASNLAVSYADQVIGDASADTTPPTIWSPQRHPWNPGSLNFGPQYGYQQYNDDGDFWIWTFVHDVSGVTSVTLKYRLDDDTTVTDTNRTYAGGTGVGSWQSLPMTYRDFPAGNFFNDPEIDFFVMPTYIADEYYVEVIDIREKLVDYYVEAEDGKGYIRRSPIQHVYIGDGTGSGGDVVVIDPDPAVAGQNVTIEYDPAGRPLDGAAQVYLHYGFNNWDPVISPDPAMTWNASESVWEITVMVQSSATQLDMVFNDGLGNWDNNNGQDWHFTVTGGQPGEEWVMDGQLDADATLVAENNGMVLYAGVKDDVLYVATWDAGEGNDHFIFVANPPGSLQSAPWAKSGQVAAWAAYLAQETDNLWTGWFDATGSTNYATGDGSGYLEGTLNLVEEFGALPEQVYLAVAPYTTPDGGTLQYDYQVPATINSDGNVDFGEYAVYTIPSEDYQLGDLNCDGSINSLDIDPFVLALTSTPPDYPEYYAVYPDCDIMLADTDADGSINSLDIDPFVGLLAGG